MPFLWPKFTELISLLFLSFVRSNYFLSFFVAIKPIFKTKTVTINSYITVCIVRFWTNGSPMPSPTSTRRWNENGWRSLPNSSEWEAFSCFVTSKLSPIGRLQVVKKFRHMPNHRSLPYYLLLPYFL